MSKIKIISISLFKKEHTTTLSMLFNKVLGKIQVNKKSILSFFLSFLNQYKPPDFFP